MHVGRHLRGLALTHDAREFLTQVIVGVLQHVIGFIDQVGEDTLNVRGRMISSD
jgi:hypothetical protein